MRKIVFILTCSLVFAACSSEHCCNTRLLQAEALCQQYPDSTIRLLDGLDIDSFSVEADRALYGLVFTEAIHRELVQMQRQKKRQLRDNSRQIKDVTARLHKTVNLGQVAKDEDISALAQCSYSLNPALLALLKPLGTKEQAVCLLIRQHFQPSEIAILVASSPQSITNLRVRLLQKLFNETGGAKDFDQRICQI